VADSSPHLQQDFVKSINNIKADPTVADEKNATRTIFHSILQSDLPAYAKTTTRLEHEAQTVIGGGIVTTAWALTQSAFYIISNTSVHSKLMAELRKAIPDISAPDAFAYEKLERLPYLGGCVKEGVRFSYGISGRNPRVLHEPVVYKDYTIPAGTAISMSVRDVNFDPSVFDEPKSFKPERWIGAAGGEPAKAPDGSSLESYFVGFGKGTRMCLGIK
jgi:cytochrome P450